MKYFVILIFIIFSGCEYQSIPYSPSTIQEHNISQFKNFKKECNEYNVLYYKIPIGHGYYTYTPVWDSYSDRPKKCK